MTHPAANQEEAGGRHGRRGLVEKMKSFFLGDDLFISYSRGDSTNYAPALANRLGARGFICYLDQYGTDIDDELPLKLKRKLLHSTALVLIGSRSAVNSTPVRQEIELFKTTGRPIIPIDVDGAFTQSDFYRLIRGLPISTDLQPGDVPQASDAERPAVEEIKEAGDRLRAAQPSDEVINRISDSFKYTKRTAWQRRLLFGGVAFLLFSFGFALYYLAVAREAAYDAEISQLRAEFARKDASDAQTQAEQAQFDRFEAQRLARQAADAESIAKGNADLADKKAAAAAAREQTARRLEAQATANAKLQQTIASSRQLASQAAKFVSYQPDRAFVSSADAYLIYPTVEARSSLLSTLQHYSHLTRMLRQHRGKVISIAYGLKGRVLVTAGEDGKLIFRDIIGNAPPAAVSASNSGDPAISVACSPGGSLCASLTQQGDVKLWEVIDAGGDLRVEPRKVTPSQPCPGSLVFINDKTLAVGCGSLLVYWNLARPDSEPEERLLDPQTTSINSLAASPDGKMLAVASQNSVQLLDADDANRPPVTLEIPRELVTRDPGAGESDGTPQPLGRAPKWTTSASFSSDGRLLAVGRSDDAVIIWDVEKCVASGDPICKSVGQPLSDAGRIVAFNTLPESKGLVTAKVSGEINQWVVDPRWGSHWLTRWRQSYKPGVYSLSFLPHPYRTFVTGSGDGAVAIWDALEEPKLGFSPPGNIRDYGNRLSVSGLAFNAAGDKLLVIDLGETRELWHAGKDKFDIHPAGEKISERVAREFPLIARNDKGTISIQNMALPKLDPQKMPIKATGLVALSPDGKTLAVFEESKGIVVWDVRDKARPAPKGSLPADGKVSEIVFSWDNKILAIGYYDGGIALWNVARRKLLRRLASPLMIKPTDTYEAAVAALAFSRDNLMLASSSSYGSIVLWDVPSGEFLGQLDEEYKKSANSLAFSRDGRKLVSGGIDGVIVWDISPCSWLRQADAIANVAERREPCRESPTKR